MINMWSQPPLEVENTLPKQSTFFGLGSLNLSQSSKQLKLVNKVKYPSSSPDTSDFVAKTRGEGTARCIKQHP